ncbi:hypothetical protein [Flammeovirga kamogawensis]|uniref:Lipoprotein n=1 Tax=Flammeovirga kamogawensis TaxID=373891 RepID=A0ABX8H5L4_9BACT|nr:hypothetical protein [Flammeovirga kamogawensis]MBB6461806.1 hypothetical protein [Flammeovirga kamogawensis]QWG10722.1 hypothetical protein KM029_25395 [Flammeovirga kamogawensis]TRX63824.1 hypothetical protein EO216_25765 [Flammeovirga kamogawensis]
MKNLFTFLLLSVMAFSFVSCGDEDEVAACDTTQIIVDLQEEFDEFTNIDDEASCEDQKAGAQKLVDFYNSNKSCINDGIDAASDTTEEAEEAKEQIDTQLQVLEALLLFPCS